MAPPTNRRLERNQRAKAKAAKRAAMLVGRAVRRAARS